MLTVTTICSCKSSEIEGDVKPGGITSVKVNISDVIFDAVHAVTSKASINQRNSSSNDGIQRNTISLNADYDLIAELSPELPSSNRNALSATGSKKAANVTETDKMALGVRYKIVAYDNDGKYVEEKNYVRGQENQETDFFLDGGKTYRFVVYSVNSTTELPSITFADNSNKTINTSNITVKGNVDFLYAIQNKTLVGGMSNEVNVILKHKFSQITTTVDASATGYNITSINAVINSHRLTAIIALSDGTITRSAGSIDATISFPALGTQTVVGTPTLINADVNNGSFTIKSIKIGDVVESNVIIFTDLVITPGVKYNMKVNLVPKDEFLIYKGQSAARINGQIWMRHNLGADYGLEPDQNPSNVGLHGNYYQWGRKVVMANGNTNLKIHIINTAPLPTNISWNSGSEANPKKNVTNDPCPDGYRVPTKAEYLKLVDNTSQASFGNWSDLITDFSSALILTSKRKAGIAITFPAQGWIAASGPAPSYNAISGIQGRGFYGMYPSSTASLDNTLFRASFYKNGYFDATRVSSLLYQYSGYTVRCIAEN